MVSRPRELPEGQIDRFEHELQRKFGEYLEAKSHQVQKYSFAIDETKGSLKPDLLVNCLQMVVEVKASGAREYVRMAIGQVLDYANLSRIAGTNFAPALVLPSSPSSDLCELIHRLGIMLIVENGNGFDFIEGEDNKIVIEKI